MENIKDKFTKSGIYSLLLDARSSQNKNFWTEYFMSFDNKSNFACFYFLNKFKEYTNEIIGSKIFPLMTAYKEDNLEFLVGVYTENSNLLYNSDLVFYYAIDLAFRDSKLLSEYSDIKSKDVSIRDFTDWGVNSTFSEGL